MSYKHVNDLDFEYDCDEQNVLKPGTVIAMPVHRGMAVWDRDVYFELRRIPYALISVRRQLTQEAISTNIENALDTAKKWGACDNLIMTVRAMHAHMWRR